MSAELARSLVVELSVKKKSSDLASLSQDSAKLKDGLEKVDKQSKVTLSGIDKMEKSTEKLKGGLKDLATSAFLLGSAGSGIEKLVMNFVRLEGALRGIRGLKDVLGSLQSLRGMGGGDYLLSASRMTGISPKALLGTATKYALPTMVGGTALLAAKAIIGGVNMADNFMTSRGAKPWLGHGGWDRNAAGERYSFSPGKIGDSIENYWIGGGKFNNRGDFVSNDTLLSRADRRMVESADRTNREVSIAEAARGVQSQQRGYQSQAFSATAGIPFYGLDRSGRDMVSSRLGSGFSGEEGRMRLLYGRDAGSERFRAMQSMLAERGRGIGSQMGLAEAGVRESDSLINRQVGIFNSSVNQKVGIVGGKENQGEALAKDRSIVEEGNKLIELEKRGIEAVKARQAARMTELSTMRDQARTLSEMYAADSASAQATMRASKQNIGAMNPIEGGMTLKMIARAKDKGFGALTPEMRQRVAQFMPEEANLFFEKQADKLKVGGKGFDEIMKGTINERRVGESAQAAAEWKQKTVELEQKIDVTAVMNEEELANLITQRLTPLLRTVEATVGRIGERVKAIEEANAGAAALRANAAGAPK